jgi:hypothetical protein
MGAGGVTLNFGKGGAVRPKFLASAKKATPTYLAGPRWLASKVFTLRLFSAP